MTIEIGIKEVDRKKVADALVNLLADNYILYLKTHGFHWNVLGPFFGILHKMFEEQYEDLQEAVDEIAERIRALGCPINATFGHFIKLSVIKEEAGVPEANEMIKQLISGQEVVIQTARKVFAEAEAADDQSTMDFIIQRLQVHEKNAWMLRSMLEDQ